MTFVIHYKRDEENLESSCRTVSVNIVSGHRLIMRAAKQTCEYFTLNTSDMNEGRTAALTSLLWEDVVMCLHAGLQILGKVGVCEFPCRVCQEEAR